MKGSREISYDDPASWPALGALRSEEGSRKPAGTDALNGRSITVSFSGGATVRFAFIAPTTLECELTAGEWGETAFGGNRLMDCAGVEVFMLAPELYVAHLSPTRDDRLAGALVLDLAAGRALLALLRLETSATARPAVSMSVSAGSIGEAAPSRGRLATTGPAMLTAELVGKRVIYDYGDGSVYEHLYLTPSLFTWLCLRGPEMGLADTESCAAYKIRDCVYLFTWREKVVPCGAAVVIDLEGSQTCGAFLGRDDDSGGLIHFTWGAHVVRVESTSYPVGVDAPWCV